MLILRERIQPIEVLTLNRPEAANSLNPPLMDELGIALQEILDDDSVRAVVVTAAGEGVSVPAAPSATGSERSARGAVDEAVDARRRQSGIEGGLGTSEQSRRIFQSDDAREGAQAFMENRTAAFSGH
jgi:enoyl-CoA hydratase